MRDVFTSRAFPQLMDSHDAKDDSTLFMTMEFAGGSLNEVKQISANRPLQEKVSLMADAMYGMAEMHRLGYIHRDLKPANILLSWDKKHALIGDFGLTTKSDTVKHGGPAVGMGLYLSPETDQGLSSTMQDVWAMGLVYYEIMFGQLPGGLVSTFFSKSKTKQDFNIQSDDKYKNVEKWLQEQDLPDTACLELLAEEIQQLLTGMLTVDPAERMSADEALRRATEISVELGNDGDVAGNLRTRQLQREQVNWYAGAPL